jgi:hypothetical protein
MEVSPRFAGSVPSDRKKSFADLFERLLKVA